MSDIHIVLKTDKGNIEATFYGGDVPVTVASFLNLAKRGYYDGITFHRVIANFMIQGGGYDQQISYVPGPKTVANESFNGIKNTKGTVAMARLSDPDSADTQFFINVKDNTHLDAAGSQAGYTVFGRISAGYEVVESIELVSTHLSHGMAAVPEELVIISSITLIE